MLKVLKTVSVIFVVYLSLLAVAGAAENAVVPADCGLACMSLSDTDDGNGNDSVSTISPATLPVNAVAMQRNYSNPDYARVVQRNVKYAIGSVIKGVSQLGSLVSERMALLLDGTPCSIARYCDGYYVIATRHILI